jgi:hypothetical protein
VVGGVPVFITVYIPFWVVAMYCYDWSPKVQKAVIGTMFAVNAISLIVFAGFLKWI